MAKTSAGKTDVAGTAPAVANKAKPAAGKAPTVKAGKPAEAAQAVSAPVAAKVEPAKSTAPKAATKKPAVKKPAAKKTAADKPAAKKTAKPEADAKPRKPKLVRDSFTMPEAEYAVLVELKKACLKAGIEVKKSELLRVGVALLKRLDTEGIKPVLAGLPSLKAGRPKQGK